MESKLVQSLSSQNLCPNTYLVPKDKRPSVGNISTVNIPIIDLREERCVVIRQIIEACQMFGFFQVINHGIPKELMTRTRRVFKEFFELPLKEKSYLISRKSNESCKFYTSSYNYNNESFHFWRDCLEHQCSSLEEKCLNEWPKKPTEYREVVGNYSAQVKELGSRLVDLICEGLGLKPGYFSDGFSSEASMVVNHYPPCPKPHLTLGLPQHCDPNLITLLLQDMVPGLQVMVDGAWLLVEPRPDSFVINVGYQFEIISNGKLKSAEHRVVTNEDSPRTTAGLFIKPWDYCTIEPAKTLVGPNDPPRYKAFQYLKFIKTYFKYNGDSEQVLEHFKLKV